MPLPGPGLQSENTGLRGGKQPRCKLALTLPGVDRIGTASQPCTEFCGPKNKLLKFSMENKSTMTTNSILTTDSNLSSKLLSTSNPLLSLSSQSHLTNKLSTSISPSVLLNSSLMSTNFLISNKPSDLDTAFSALTSNVSLSPNCAITSSSFLSSGGTPLSTENQTFNRLLSQKNTTLRSSVFADSAGDHSFCVNNQFDISNPSNSAKQAVTSVSAVSSGVGLSLKSSFAPKTEPLNSASNVQSTLEFGQDKIEVFESQEDDLPEDNILVNSSEGESESSDTEDSEPSAQEKSVEEASEALKSQKSETLLKKKKMALISAVCCSLVNSPAFSDPSDLTRVEIQTLCEDIARMDPEFVLKIALYTRQELNIRSTANFLLAVAAFLPACRPHLRRYFSPSVQLPSDWMEVPRLYQSLSGKGDNLASLPHCLRRALALKFKEFSEFQLAKYNTRVQRGKRDAKKKKEKEVKVSKVLKFGRKLRAVESSLKLLQKQPDQADSASNEKKKKKDKFSLKSLIQRLHISKPAYHVMSLLGCRYPKDLTSFSRSGIEGPWQSHLSGQRMKLKQPETWERELSQKGNSGPVWESLLDNRKVPFMALLRNLRNMIKAGISKKHHTAVNARLTNQHAVIQSRLFPFRFLSAYKVIQDLERQIERAGEPFPSNADLLRRIFRREGKNIPAIARNRFQRHELRACLAVPVVHQLLRREKEAIRKARMITFDEDILQSYKKSLEESIRISAVYNIPPIPGRTVILMHVGNSMYLPCHGAKELAVSTTADAFRSSPSLMDVGLLLSLMVKETAESAQLVLCSDYDYTLVEHSSSPLLQRLEEIKEQRTTAECPILPYEERDPQAEYLLELLKKQTKVDNILVFTDSPPSEEFQTVLKQYRRAVNMECLCVTVLPHGFKSEGSIEQCKDVTLCGFTEQVLKYVSERGTDRLLDHVEKVNERFKVPEDPDKVKKSQSSQGLLTTIPKQRWRSVRVFISSTFRDMHSERDILIGQVMPQLRLRAASHFLSLEEVDLRWGITEEETKKDRQLSLCLSEVVRSQIFIGILGERYGYTPKTYSVPHLPEYEWVHTYPAGRSVTELEAMQFLQGCNTQKHRHPKALFYFRNPDVLGSVPSHWLPDFAAESQEAAKHVKNLKNKVAKHRAVSSYLYSCQWGGEHNEKPHITALEDFASRVLEDIWQVIERDFIKESNAFEDEEQLAQEGFQEWHEQRSFARSKLVTNVCAEILEKRRTSSTNGQLFLVVGEPSQGKTVFMADLVKELSLAASSSVIYYFTEATTRATEAESMLNSVCKQLNQRLQRRSSNPTSYRSHLAEFQALLQLTSRSLKRSDTLILLIDGADVLCGHAGEFTSDWIPDLLPQKVNLVLSVTEGSSLCSSLRKRKDTIPITLGRLEPSERAELVRGKLALYGKKLEESAFNNQLRLLMIKKGTRDPLYLTMACEELRMSAVFEKLSDDIQKLPATLPPLIQKRLEMLEEEHGANNVGIALTAICISRKGLWERDLLRILSSMQQINSVYTASWDEMLSAAINANNIPMATFSLLLTGLKSVLGLWNRNMTSEPRLHLSSCLLREAVEKRYFGKSDVVHTVHLLIAAHFWAVSSPEDPESSPALHAECLSELSHHLLCGRQFHTMGKLLISIPFLKAHAVLGLLSHLCQVYSRYETAISEETSSLSAAQDEMETNEISEPPVREFKEFIERSLYILTQNPSLFYQLALNEPDTSPVCIQAQEILADFKSPASELITAWNNKPNSTNVCSSKSLDVPSTPGCVGLSANGDMAVLGTSNGSLHILYTNSGEEVRTLYSGCDGVSTCTFISEALLCIGSYDGIMEIWNITDGCRLHRIEAHRRQVTGCCISADHKQLITCSLDCQLKSWDTSRYSLLSSTTFSSPLNCTAFHPRGHEVAVGSWDGKISVVRLENWKRSAVMQGSSSVRTVSFSMEGSVVVSGYLDGWVSLWSWETQVELSRFRAHSGSALTANFLHHGEYLLTGGEDGKVQVSSGGLGRFHGRACVNNAQSPVLSLALSPNRELLAVGYHSDSVGVYSVATGDLLTQCMFSDVAVSSLVWLSDSVLVSGSSDSLVRVWNVFPGPSACRLTLLGHQRSILGLALSSKLLASASEDVSVCLWSVESLLASDPTVSPVSVLRGHTAAITCCSFSPDGRLLVTGGQDRSVLCWDVSVDPPILSRSLLSCHKDWVTGCSWTDSGMLISGSGDGSLCLWDIQQGKQILTFAGHQSAVSSVACMGERVISTSRDGYLKVWSLTGLEVANIRTDHNQITQSAAYWEPKDSRADADIVVCTAGSDGTVLKWSPLQMEQIQTLYGHGGAVMTSATNSRHEVSVTAAHDGSVRLWGKPCRDEGLKGIRHKGAVSAITWSPDGELVVSAGEFGDLIVWKEQKAVLNLQCGELCISSVVFTTQRSFCIISNDLTISRWLLFPCKGGGLRAKKAYSVEIESLVLSAIFNGSQKVQLHTLSGKVFLMEPKTGSMQDIHAVHALLPDPNFKPPDEELNPGCIITASQRDFGVSDSTGALWLQSPRQSSQKSSSGKWEQKQIHSASISCLNMMNDLVITASTDRSVKIWRCNPFRQVGIFNCEGSVTCLSPCPVAQCDTPSVACRIACGDQYGNMYLLTSLQV
ncbi:telomerase protein component 1-like isoform X2 [Rana temporaria]|uniref:telomerase protein component 1-like isoform X2 n=1 Tax=Rana temporaria TaxID=8407 RepID=UPI001AAD5C4A|nr:telomerase protein component 1-like isoform X2 [Rana temporaria]